MGLFTTVIYASESEELCRGSEFTKVSRRECENELVVVDAHTINRTKEDTHTHTTKQEKKFLFFFFFCATAGALHMSHQPTSTLSKKQTFYLIVLCVRVCCF